MTIWHLNMERTDDILAYLGAHKNKGSIFSVDFLWKQKYAREFQKKLKKKNLDMDYSKQF